jgi:HSP20 family protein
MLSLTRWNPFDPGSLIDQFNDLQRDVNRMLRRLGRDGARLIGMEGALPALNVWESDNTYHVEAELPGLEMKDVELFITGGNQLRIKSERKPIAVEKAKWLRNERIFGTFVRLIDLPAAVDAEMVKATLENGILHIELPKHESARPRKIDIKTE